MYNSKPTSYILNEIQPLHFSVCNYTLVRSLLSH